MHIDVRAKDFDLTDVFRDHVQRRVRIELTRFADRMDSVAGADGLASPHGFIVPDIG